MYVTLRSSTFFEQHLAHPQEDKLYYYSIQYTCVLYSCLQRVTIPEAVVIQFVLLLLENVEDRNVTYILLKNKGIVH